MAKVGNLFNPDRINLGEAIPLETPLVIQLEPSGFCNLKCTFCPAGQDSGIQRDTMTAETFDLFLSQCLAFPQKIKILRIIGIGEPLLNKSITEFAAKAKRSEAFDKVEITTNGVLLTPELSDGLIAAGLDTLLVSLEAADEKRFKEIAGVTVDLEKMRENFKYYFEHKNPNSIFYIKTTDFAFEEESDSERERFLSVYGDISDEIQIEHIYENWPEFQAGTAGDSVRFDMEQYKEKKTVCVQPFKLLCVAANGDVMPCCADWKRTLLLGNIKQTSLLDIWNGGELRNLRVSLLNEQFYNYCKVCSVPKSNQPDNIDGAKKEIMARLEKVGG